MKPIEGVVRCGVPKSPKPASIVGPWHIKFISKDGAWHYVPARKLEMSSEHNIWSINGKYVDEATFEAVVDILIRCS